eukprot:300021-Pyramimonas_sp.AAC.1
MNVAFHHQHTLGVACNCPQKILTDMLLLRALCTGLVVCKGAAVYASTVVYTSAVLHMVAVVYTFAVVYTGAL